MPRAVAKPMTIQAALASGAVEAKTPLRSKEVAEVGFELIATTFFGPAVQKALTQLFEPAGIRGELPMSRKFEVASILGPLSMYLDRESGSAVTNVRVGFLNLHNAKLTEDTVQDFDQFALAVRDLESRFLSLNDPEPQQFSTFLTLLCSRSRPESGAYRAAINTLIAKDKRLTALGCKGFGFTPYDGKVRLLFEVPEVAQALAGNHITTTHPWTRLIADGAGAAKGAAEALGGDIGELVTTPSTQKALFDAARRLMSDTIPKEHEWRRVNAQTEVGKLTLTTTAAAQDVGIAFSFLSKGSQTTPEGLLATRALAGKLTPAERAERRFAALSGLAQGWTPALVDAVNAGLARTRVHQAIPGLAFTKDGQLTFPTSPV